MSLSGSCLFGFSLLQEFVFQLLISFFSFPLSPCLCRLFSMLSDIPSLRCYISFCYNYWPLSLLLSLFYSMGVFHTSVCWWFSTGVSANKSPQVSRTLVNLNNAVVWMVMARPFISKFSSPITNLLVTTLSNPVTISITVTFMFHSLFSSLAR